MKRLLALILVALMITSVLPVSILATAAETDDIGEVPAAGATETENIPAATVKDGFDPSVSGDYFSIISEETYNLAPGAKEVELILNNADGSDRKVVHYFEVDTKNETIEVLPGYYGIDKLDPNNLALEGVADKTKFWKAEQLTKTVAYYENLGYNVVGAMNTALAYDSDAPYGYMVWNGVVLGTPEVHKGADTYLAIDGEGNCELRSMSTPLNGTEVTAISANFGWIVKDGELVSKTVERTSSDASRSMIGIKADGTLVFCLVDGRNAPFSTGLSNYELGEMMLSLGCVNAVNCDGGGSSTFVSKREGETEAVMRSVPSDGSERATINSVIIVSTATPTGEFDHAVLSTDYDYYAPGTSAQIHVKGVDASGGLANSIPVDTAWALSDNSFGYVENGVFVSNGTKGDVVVQMLYKGAVVGEKLLHIVDPDVFALLLDETVLPYGKSMNIDFACTYGVDDWAVCVDGAYTLALSDNSAALLNGTVLLGTSDETVSGVDVIATYVPNPTVTDVLKVTYGKGSEIIYSFEDGTTAGFVNFDDAKQYSIDNGINNTLVGTDPLGGQFSEQVDGEVFVSDKIVKNGNYSLAWSIDNTDAGFAGWTYNVLFNIGETIVLRDVANGKNATTLGMWLYIPEGAAGLAFQSQLYTKSGDTLTHWQDHFTFTTVDGVVKNLNSCTEADIPESRWVYASINLTAHDYVCTPVASLEGNNRTPSFIRTYVKPMVPAVHTFYIDDITLDYSSAVDDRVLPTISDVSYATQDESVTLNEGAVIFGNNISFSAVVADNIKLDYTTGRILVDGNELTNVSASGKYLATTSSVTLAPGVHTVSFEIKDDLGNLGKVTRTFTVAGNAPIALDGHNDSGRMPEYGSVYYVDVNVADISAVNKLTAALLLQDANTWEPQGITAADGFEVTYTLDKVENILTITVARNGEEIDSAAAAIVSVPVRLWTWDAIDHVTGLPVAPETQYKTGYCPVVTVDCEVLKGLVNDTDPFGGKISVETMINDIVNPWHYHDAELAVLNQDASCTAAGYINRTYCNTCMSVIDWGTAVAATGHHYENGKCACGATNTATGLVVENGNWYYYINGVAASGWQMIGSDWYYFDRETKIGAEGDVILDGITFNFTNAKLTTGVWAKTLFGTRYYNGPTPNRSGWYTIDGKDYCFENYQLITGGYQVVRENNINTKCYYFNEDGSCDKNAVIPDGFITDRNGLAYIKDGSAVIGLQEIDGVYYYFSTMISPARGYAQKGNISGYLFGDDYKAVTGLVDVNGEICYYENGKPKMAGAVEIDGDVYFAGGSKGQITVGQTQYVWQGNGILPEATYEFDIDGKLTNGIVKKNGTLYYYVNGKPQMAGLVEVDGALYFAYGTKGEIATDTRYVWKANGILPEATYEFGADGKMLDGIVEKNGTLYYYVNGQPKMAGLVEVDGALYFAGGAKGEIVVGRRYYVWDGNDILPNATYEFGADGKMLNGIVEKDGTLYYYVNGQPKCAGLVEVDGALYFAGGAKGEITVDRTYYVWEGNDILPNGTYEFGADGKMLDGIVEKNGTLYYYVNGRPKCAGLVEVDGALYFAGGAKGEITVDRRYYVWEGNGILPNGTYEFGADGKMLDGFVTKADGIYYYENGQYGKVGLNYIEGYYYFIDYNGKLFTNGTYYVWATNGLSIQMNYTFDEFGRIVK